MADIQINNQKEFFDKIILADNGVLIISVKPISSPIELSQSQYNFYKKVKLSEEGFLNVTEI
jgi:hypothetical protein